MEALGKRCSGGKHSPCTVRVHHLDGDANSPSPSLCTLMQKSAIQHSHKSAQVPEIIDERVEIGDVVCDLRSARIHVLQPSLEHFCHACVVRGG